MTTSRLRVSSAGALSLAWLAACSAGGGDDSKSTPQAGAGGIGWPGAGGTPPGTGNVPNGSGGNLGFGGGEVVPPERGSGGGKQEGCGVVQKPEQVIEYSPIALYIMLDRSGSMITGVPEGNPQSWQNSTDAINAFVTDPSSAGIDVGLGFFPNAPANGWMCSDGTGSGTDCNTPAVEIGPVAQTGPQLTSSMNASVPAPLNFTPTECGLIGMVEHCKQWTAQTGEQCVAILVTDGNPTLCTPDVNALAKIVADGKAAGVTTFVLVLPGANASVLDPIAQAGGSNASIDVTAGTAAIIAALNTIRGQVAVGTALPCTWKIPPPPEGLVFEQNKVNVKFTAQGAAPEDFGFVAEADCARASNAWYFDNPAAPTQVLVCPQTCEMLTASIGAQIDVEFGCETKPAILR